MRPKFRPVGATKTPKFWLAMCVQGIASSRSRINLQEDVPDTAKRFKSRLCYVPLLLSFQSSVLHKVYNRRGPSSFPLARGDRIGFLIVFCITESIEWCIEGQAFSRSNDLAPRPPPSVSSTGETQEHWEREKTCWRVREGGWARSRVIFTTRMPGSL
jgi:hypothetical protein